MRVFFIGCSSSPRAVRPARVLLAGLLACVLLAPAAADARTYQPAYRDLGRWSQYEYGSRYVTMGDAGDLSFSVLDTKTGQITRTPMPDGCLTVWFAWVSSSERVTLASCAFSDGSLGDAVIDRLTGETLRSASRAAPDTIGDSDSRWVAVGDQWLRDRAGLRFMNWHTGERRTFTTAQHRDLNDPELGEQPPPLCAPFDALPRVVPGGQYGRDVLLRDAALHVQIGRCGSTRPPVTLSPAHVLAPTR